MVGGSNPSPGTKYTRDPHAVGYKTGNGNRKLGKQDVPVPSCTTVLIGGIRECWGVAQLVEHQTLDLSVDGSSPSPPAKIVI